MSQVTRGTIARIPIDRETQARRGFFFITLADGEQDVFAYRNGMQWTSSKQFDDLRVGDEVEFILIAGEKGPKAIEIRTL